MSGVREGDLVRVPKLGMTGVMVKWNGEPDSHALVLDDRLETALVYADGCERLGDTVEGRQILEAPILREMRRRLLAYAASRPGKRQIRDARARTTLIIHQDGTREPRWNAYTRGEVDMPTTGAGAPPAWQLPWEMADDRGVPTEKLMRYITFWTGRERGLLDALYAHNSDWWHAVMWRADDRPAAELAEFWGVEPSTIVRYAKRGRAWLRAHLTDYTEAHRSIAA